MLIRQQVEQCLRSAVEKAAREKGKNLNGFIFPGSSVRAPENNLFGDYASALPFQLAKVWGMPPHEIGGALTDALAAIAPKGFFEKIEVIKGFLNMTLSPGVYAREIAVIGAKKEAYGSAVKKKEKISLDYLDANPTGPVHIGHARSGFLGDAISRVLKKSGYGVSREFYINNARASGQIRSLGRTAIGTGEEYKHEQMADILSRPSVKTKLKKITNEKEAGFLIAAVIQKENADFLKKKANIVYDVFFEEETVYKKGLIKKVLAELKKKNAIYEKDGAVWLRAKEYGDTEDRVIVRSDGSPTYVLPDIAYHIDRLRTRKFDSVINIFGADHHGYGPRLKGALMVLGIDPLRVRIINTQTVRLMKNGEEFKMSKRKGLFVTLEELIDEVGLDAARFFFLAQSPDTHMDFDMDLAKEQSNKNPVYYVQYSHARIASILNKVKSLKLKVKNPDMSVLKKEEELQLMKWLVRFPELVEDTAHDYHVLRLTTYATELARAFHHFYEQCRVIGDDKNLTAARLVLVRATQIVLKNTLDLMGISSPEKM